MKIVFVCSPYRGDVEANTKLAKTLCRALFVQNVLPYAPHLFLTQFLDDNIPEERKAALEANKEMIFGASAVWAFVGNGLSEGMQEEIKFATDEGVPVFLFSTIEEWETACQSGKYLF